MLHNNITAVIDIGSNSIRLVFYKISANIIAPIHHEKILSFLAKGMMDNGGMLNKRGISIVIKALERFLCIIKEHNIKNLFIIATSAVRDATDKNKFIQEIQEKFKIKINILSGKEEAKYILCCIKYIFNNASGIIAELGGGSLEISSLRTTYNILDSFPVGTVRVNRLTIESYNKILNKYLKKLATNTNYNIKNFYAVGGLFQAIARQYIQETKYPLTNTQNYSVKTTEILPYVQQKIKDYLKINRIIKESKITSKIIFVHIIKIFNPENIIFSFWGLREGFIIKKLELQTEHNQLFYNSCLEYINAKENMMQYIKKLFYWTSPILINECNNIKKIHFAACILSNLLDFSYENNNNNCIFEKILYSKICHISHNEKIILALFANYLFDNKINKKHEKFTKLLKGNVLNYIILLANSLKFALYISTKSLNILNKTNLKICNNYIELHIDHSIKNIINDIIQGQLQNISKLLNLKYKIIVNKIV